MFEPHDIRTPAHSAVRTKLFKRYNQLITAVKNLSKKFREMSMIQLKKSEINKKKLQTAFGKKHYCSKFSNLSSLVIVIVGED